MGELLFILFQAALINNFILVRILGVCPAIGAPRQLQASVGMGLAVTLVMVLASLITWFIQVLILAPLGASFLQLLFFMIIIVSLIQLLSLFFEQKSPQLKKLIGGYVPLLIANCAVLGVTLINVQNQLNLLESIFYALGAGLGYLMVLVLLSSIAERLEFADIPRAFRGVPIILVVAAVLSLALTVFSSYSVP